MHTAAREYIPWGRLLCADGNTPVGRPSPELKLGNLIPYRPFQDNCGTIRSLLLSLRILSYMQGR